YFLGLLSSNVSHTILKIINPTLAFQVGDINKIPLIYSTEKKNEIINHVKNNIYISKKDWNSRETSWDFTQNELIHISSDNLSSAIERYKAYWKQQFYQLHQNEEELNRQFIEIYGLQEELTPYVALE